MPACRFQRTMRLIRYAEGASWLDFRTSQESLIYIMLLTICVPTLNRAFRVSALAQYLINLLQALPEDEVELLISDNASRDETWEKLALLPKAPFVRLIKREQFITTAEEHFISLIEESRGDFVWILGDDDLPNAAGFHELLTYLRADAADIYVCNHREITQDGSLLTSTMVPMNAPWIDIAGRDLMLAAGFISTLSMFSNVVFRRSAVSTDLGREILQISRIYSHVAWHVTTFANMRARIVNNPLVNHRADFASIKSYFESYNRTAKQSQYYIWTTGLIKLIRYLIDSRIVKAQDLARVYEHEFDGRGYRLVDKIVHYVFLRLDAAMRNHFRLSNKVESNDLYTEEDFDEIATILIKIDPGMQDQLFTLGKIRDLLNRKNRSVKKSCMVLRRKFMTLHHEQIAENLYQARFVGSYYGCDFYRSLTGYVAILRTGGFRDRNIYRILSVLDPMPEQGRVWVGSDLPHLIASVLEGASRLYDSTAAQGVATRGLDAAALSNLIDSVLFAMTPLRWMGKFMIKSNLKARWFVRGVRNRLARYLSSN